MHGAARLRWRELSPVLLPPAPALPAPRRATGLLEAGGYAALIYCIQQSGKSSIFNAYVAMQVLVVLSPNVIQAAMYWQVRARGSARAARLARQSALVTAPHCPMRNTALPAARCTCSHPPPSAAAPSVSVQTNPQVGLVLAFSPDLTRGRRLLRGWVVTLGFALADLGALT